MSTNDPDAPPPSEDLGPEVAAAMGDVMTLATVLVGVSANRDGLLSPRQRDAAWNQFFGLLVGAVGRLDRAEPVYGLRAARVLDELLVTLAEDDPGAG